MDFHDSVKAARERGITVNTLHCGGYEEGSAGKWKDAAVLAGGSDLNIDHNQRVVEILAPQDTEIAQLGAELLLAGLPHAHHGHGMTENSLCH